LLKENNNEEAGSPRVRMAGNVVSGGEFMQRIVTSMLVVSLLFAIHGCGVAKRATRSPETDALLRAASMGNADTVRSILVSPNVDVNGIDEHGNTALIEAARFGHDEVVTALLMAKADMKVKNDEGKTALMLAAEGGHDETVRMLTQAGAGK
jgi:ankyrin repeat protein